MNTVYVSWTVCGYLAVGLLIGYLYFRMMNRLQNATDNGEEITEQEKNILQEFQRFSAGERYVMITYIRLMLGWLPIMAHTLLGLKKSE